MMEALVKQWRAGMGKAVLMGVMLIIWAMAAGAVTLGILHFVIKYW